MTPVNPVSTPIRDDSPAASPLPTNSRVAGSQKLFRFSRTEKHINETKMVNGIATKVVGEISVVNGLGLAQKLRAEMAEEVSALRRPPCLVTVRVGEDPASCAYVAGKHRACRRVGFTSRNLELPANITQEELLAQIEALNRDGEVDGILVQLPLPKGLDAVAVACAIAAEKDVDGVGPVNAGRLLVGGKGLFPCTPLGILAILDHHGVQLSGANAVVIGRSNIVGKPVSLLLQRRDASVTMCHSRTRELSRICKNADLLVACTGVPRLVKANWIKRGATVVDVGATYVNGEPVGDVDYEAVIARDKAKLITPHRRGVGPMTITMLLRNTLDAYRQRMGAA